MARQFVPQKAVRKGQKARVALAGPSGSGKTWTALETATILAAGAPILVADTERGSASLYADYFDFEVVEWDPPFDPRELGDLIDQFAGQYGAIVVDSLTHFWEGEGGTRDIVDAAAARARGNSFAGWKEGTPAQNDMVASLLNAPCHIVATMRSKTEYVLETDSRGKQVPKRIGMAPVQRQGIEYEFTVTADLDWEHTLLIDKTRCHPLAGRMMKIGHTKELGETLAKWLDSAEAIASAEQVEQLRADLNAGSGEMRAEFRHRFGLPQHLTVKQVDEARAWLDQYANQQGAGDDGPDSGGDDGGGPVDGADGHDVGRTEPEPAPTILPGPEAWPEASGGEDGPEFMIDDGDLADGPADVPATAGSVQRPDGGGPITEGQSRRLHALLREKRGAIGPQRFPVLSAIVGRPISSSRDLTSDEAYQAIQVLNAEDPSVEPVGAAS